VRKETEVRKVCLSVRQTKEDNLNSDNARASSQYRAKPGEIADPVHRYIRFTSIEREIIDHRITQRLRYISQAGLAQLVYPELRTSRFSHSLGVMHLASQFLTTSLRNASADVRRDLFKGLNEAVKKSCGRFGSVPKAAKVLENEPLETGEEATQDACPGIRLVEQALRLAALFHDLGHLPYSHDFETAIEELCSDQKVDLETQHIYENIFEQNVSAGKLHERLGRRLSELLLLDIIDDIPPEKQVATKVAFDLAQQIFDSTVLPTLTNEETSIRWLHTLIDGEIDVDRCDYILRDGRNYAFEFATLDLSRLTGNLVAARQNDSFVLAVLPHGLSAVEDFLLARYRSYQYGVRHHKVVQVGAGLQHCIKEIIKNPRKSERFEEFKQDINDLARVGADGEEHDNFLARFEDKEERGRFLDRIATYDDIWWTGIMRAYDRRDEWFELACWRKPGPRTLWKSLSDFPIGMDIANWNARLPENSQEQNTSAWFSEKLALEREGVIIVRHKFQPWETERSDGESNVSKLCVLMKGGDLQAVTKLSQLVKSLPSAWMAEIQVHAFRRSDCLLSKQDVFDRISATMKEEESNGSSHIP